MDKFKLFLRFMAFRARKAANAVDPNSQNEIEKLEAGGSGRSPAGGNAVVLGSRNGEISEQCYTAKERRNQNRALHDGSGCDLTFGKKGDETIVVRRAGVVMQQFMERRADGEGGVGEQKEGQETGEGRFRNQGGSRFIAFHLQT